MKVINTLTLCQCCAMMLANADNSSCRDHYGHTHREMSVPPDTVLVSEGREHMRHFPTRCDGHGEEIEFGGTYFTADVLG